MTGRAPWADALPSDNAVERLRRLPSGRHYGASADSGCWIMIGRDLRDVESWSIVPPAASLTLAWGDGGCSLEFAGGSLRMHPGDCMWIDAGFVHRGENMPGSDFLTLFIPEGYVTAAALDRAPIGAAREPAPLALRGILASLAAMLLEGGSTQAMEAPLLDATLDWVRAAFAPRGGDHPHDPVARAAAALRDHRSDLSIAAIAQDVGLTQPALSRRFKARFRVTPKLYRKQVRLAFATRALARGCSVTEAAHEAGFADSAHLSRSFQEQYAIAPSRWARLLMRQPASA